MIERLHNQDLDTLPTDNDEEVEELQEEIIVQNEYSYQLKCNINKLKKTLKVNTSNLNAAADSSTVPMTEAILGICRKTRLVQTKPIAM